MNECKFFEHILCWWPELSTLLLLLIVGTLLCSPFLLLKTVSIILRIFMFRVKITGTENLPASGPVLLVANHISIVDMIMIQAASKRPIRFMVRKELALYFPLTLMFRLLGVLCLPSPKSQKQMKKFMADIKNRLRSGEVICYFPEGGISGSGNLMRFRSGVKKLLPTEVFTAVIPIRLGMVHGRLTGIHQNRLKLRPLTRWPVDFSVTVGCPLDPNLSSFQLRQKISELGAKAETPPQPGERPIHTAFIFRAKRKLWDKIFFDAPTEKWFSNFKMLMLTLLLSKVVRKIDQGTNGYTGVLLPNTPAAAGVLLGILSADRTPAVMNFSVGREVALSSMRRAGIKTILTSKKFIEKLKWEISPEMIMLEDIIPTISKWDKFKTLLKIIFCPAGLLARKTAPLSWNNMFHEAVLLFSSGSTGKPKAVMLTQRNISCNVMAFLRVVDWSFKDRVGGNLPMFHSFGFTVCFALPAVTGTPVAYVANPLDSSLIVKTCRNFRVTILCATPTFLQKYMQKAADGDFKTLRLCITGAEKLRTELADRYREMTGRDIIEGYGCTELSPIVTINLNNSIYTLGTHSDHPGSIGCPLPGIHARIVDIDTGIEVPPGREGRLQVSAGTVMKGYLNDPEQTDRVIQNGYYDTGDIGRMDEDGFIYITGRATRFSKIGGEMVPHEAIEDAITRILHSEVREVAVTGRPDPLKGERIVVFYTPADLNPAEIIAQLRATELPNIWIPKAENFVKVDHIPLLGSGKLDLVALKSL